MLNADPETWVSRQSHLRSQLSSFQATRIAVSSCPILRAAHPTNFRQTVVMPSASKIDGWCKERWFLLMACGHHLMSLSGLTYSLNKSGSRRIFVAVFLALLTCPLYLPCVFLFRTRLSRNTSAEIWMIPTCSPAVSISKDMKTASSLLLSYWISFDRPLGTALPATAAGPPPPDCGPSPSPAVMVMDSWGAAASLAPPPSRLGDVARDLLFGLSFVAASSCWEGTTGLVLASAAPP